MNRYKTFALLCALFSVFRWSLAQSPAVEKRIVVHSEILNEDRTVLVGLPDDYESETYAPYEYPVLYFFDADRHFQSIAAITEFLAEGPYASIPKMIIVGIINTDRARDLTPTEVKFKQDDKFQFKSTGGNARFNQFITEELMEFVNTNYRTSGFNIMMGHSFGGLATINTLLSEVEAFNGFIAHDPSIWWDDEYLCQQLSIKMNDPSLTSKSLYFSGAHDKPLPNDTTTEHERAIAHFEALLANNENDLRWKYQYFPEDDHGNVSLPATYYGLKFIFDGFQQEVKLMFENPDLLKIHYKQLSNKLQFEIQPAEWLVDWMGDYCNKTNRAEQAKQFYQWNAELYTNSAHAAEKLTN